MNSEKAVEVELADESKALLTVRAVRDATAEAELADPDDDTRTLAEIDNRRFDPVTLVALALAVPPDLIRARPALQALAELDVHLVGYTQTKRRETAEREPYEEPPEQQPPSHDFGLEDVSPELGRKLQRKRGRWVAIRNGNLVADDETLHGVLSAAQGSQVTVLFVPPKDA